MHNHLKVAVLKPWRSAMLASAAISLTACMAGPSGSSSSSVQVVESSSQAVSSSSQIVVQSSSSMVASSSSAPVISSSSSSEVSSIAQSSSSVSQELGDIVPRTTCPSAPPPNQDIDLPGEFDLDISKDEIEAMLTKMPTFEGSRWDLPWHMWEPEQAAQSGDLFPLVVSLHGAWAAEPGGNESGPGNIRQDGAPYMLGSSNGLLTAENQSKYPTYMIFPHCLQSEGCHWSLSHEWAAASGANFGLGNEPSRVMSSVLELIQYMVDNYKVDPARVYVTGVSMGGGGTWDMVARHPELLAAAVPLAGHTPRTDQLGVAVQSKLPVWAHGSTADNNNPLRDTRNAVQYIDQQGGCAWVTEYQNIPHNHTLWQRIYLNPDLWPWLFAQKQPREGEVQSSSSSPVVTSSSASSSSVGSGNGQVIFQDDFEGNSVGAAPANWNFYSNYSKQQTANTNEFSVVSDAASGTKALKVTGDQNAPRFIAKELPAGLTQLYMRAYIKPSNSIGNTAGINHSHFLATHKTPYNPNDREFRFGEVKKGIGFGTSQPDDLAPSGQATSEHASMVIPANQWSCVEIGIHTEGDDRAIAWLDDQLLIEVNANTTWQNGAGDEFVHGALNLALFGWQGWSAGANTIIYDDIVIATDRIGCN